MSQLRPPTLGSLEGRLFEAVIFDMDGTLVDSTPAVERSWRAWAEHYGLTEDDFVDTHGMPSASIVARLIPQALQEEAARLIDELEVNDVADVVPLPGAVEALAAIPEARRAIATSCHRPLMDARLRASGVGHPAVTVTINDVERGKPNPDPFLRAAQLLGKHPADCLVVEDAVSGLTGAKAAGCATLAVITTTAEERLASSGLVDGLVPLLDAVRFVPEAGGVRIELA